MVQVHTLIQSMVSTIGYTSNSTSPCFVYVRALDGPVTNLVIVIVQAITLISNPISPRFVYVRALDGPLTNLAISCSIEY